MSTVNIPDLHGEFREVNLKDLIIRPTVYGFIIHEGKFVSWISHISNTYTLPGGRIEIGESTSVALQRESREELGLEIEVGNLLYADDPKYYSEKKSEAYQMYVYYYVCRPVLRHGKVHLESNAEVSNPTWLSVTNVPIEKFHPVSQPAMRIIVPLLKNYV